MFALIESAPAARGNSDWTSRMASATLHTAVIAAAIVATQHVTNAPLPGITRIDTVWQVPPAPPAPATSPSAPSPPTSVPRWSVLPSPTLDVPTEIPPPGTTEFLPGPTGDPMPGPILTALPGGLPGAGHVPVDARLVDELPALVAHPELRYPEVLRQAGIEGRVLVEAVLDTLGRAEAGSLRVTESPNVLFDREALAVVAASRYRPGRVDGRAVRVRIQVPVAFAIRR